MIQPQNGYYHARLLAAEKVLPSGIILPDQVVGNTTDAEVLAVGPGKQFGNGHRHRMLARVGDRIIIRENHFHACDRAQREGFVSDLDLVAILPAESGHSTVLPANGYLLVQPERAATHRGGIILPERSRRRPDCGTVRECGPGTVRTKGELAGVRRSIGHELNLYGLHLDTEWLVGLKVWWDKDAEIVELTGDDGWIDTWLVHARDVLCVEAL